MDSKEYEAEFKRLYELALKQKEIGLALSILESRRRQTIPPDKDLFIERLRFQIRQLQDYLTSDHCALIRYTGCHKLPDLPDHLFDWIE